MRNLTRAHEQLFRRTPDETFESLDLLGQHCRQQKEGSVELWQPPAAIGIQPVDSGRLQLSTPDREILRLNDWSFSQLCRLSRVAKDTVNRLTPQTASEVFCETLPRGNKPLQMFAQGDLLRSVHMASYTRLFNADLLEVAREAAPEFQPPPKGASGGTGLYAGEQDMFCFLIDPAGWIEIEGEPFAPGFFLFNSEVGNRSVGIETFWFQKICANHIVWDAVEVIEFTRKHTANVSEALEDVRRLIDALVTKRDSRRDGFAKVIAKAMQTKLGQDSEEVEKALSANGIPRMLAQQATEIARRQGSFTIFSLVDVLTRLGGELVNAGHRLEVDQRASRLLTLAA